MSDGKEIADLLRERTGKQQKRTNESDEIKVMSNSLLTQLGRLEAMANNVQVKLFSLKHPDAQSIYQEYLNTKTSFIKEIDRLTKLQKDLEQNGVRNIQQLDRLQQSISERLNILENTFQKIISEIDQIENVRQRFNIPDQIDNKDMSNYYGVYVYNEMLEKGQQTLTSLSAQGESDSKIHSEVKSSIEKIRTSELKLQTEYKTLLESLISDLKEAGDEKEVKRWENELQTVKKRTEDSKQGIINQAYTLAINQITKSLDERSERKEEVESEVEPEESSIEIVPMEDVIEEESKEIEEEKNNPVNYAFIPESVVFTRAFESDTPNMDQTFKLRYTDDLNWKNTSIGEKQVYIKLATVWANENNIRVPNSGKGKLIALLRGIALKLGLDFFQYAPILDNTLKSSALKWNDNEMTTQMQNACKKNIEDKQQSVIRPETWRDEIVNVAKGKEPPTDGVYGWLLMDPLANKFYGIVHGRDARKISDVVDFKISNVKKNQALGAPLVRNIQDTLDITFVCSQRNDRYKIDNKKPRHLGTLMILWILASLLNNGFYGVMLQVVGVNAGDAEGISSGEVDTSVASYYHRYFKFQRTSTLNEYAKNGDIDVFDEQGGGRPYYIVTGKKEDIMYRPYPTVDELTDMVARLTQKIQTYYFS